MKDSDIIKALECCGNQMYSCTDKRCKAKTLGKALDLINRQKAEIERYKGVIKILEKDVSDAKSEAIKDFIAEFERRCIDGGIYPAFVKRQLEHVKEEMVGE